MPSQRQIRIQLDVLNMDGETLSSIDERVQDGQVDVATDSEGPTRSLTLKLYDPDHKLRLDSDAPTDGSLYADRMLRPWYGVKVPGVGWVDVPVFTGPIVKVNRVGSMLNVECQGKEALALQPVWETFTVPKGTTKTDAIRRLLRECAGETDFDIPDLKVRLGSHATLTPQPPDKRQQYNAESPWRLAQKIARSMGMHLYYDGHGRCRLRRLPGSPLFTFDGSLIQSPDGPDVSFDLTEMRNAVKVTGKTLHEGKEKKGPQLPKHEVSGRAVAPDHHPLSPKRLGRHQNDGTLVPRYIPEFVTNDAIRSDKEATRHAKQVLDDLLAQSVDIGFDALPVPHLEEMDMVRVKYEDLNFNMRLKRFSLPLTHEGVMSVGSVKRVTKPGR